MIGRATVTLQSHKPPAEGLYLQGNLQFTDEAFKETFFPSSRLILSQSEGQKEELYPSSSFVGSQR